MKPVLELLTAKMGLAELTYWQNQLQFAVVHHDKYREAACVAMRKYRKDKSRYTDISVAAEIHDDRHLLLSCSVLYDVLRVELKKRHAWMHGEECGWIGRTERGIRNVEISQFRYGASFYGLMRSPSERWVRKAEFVLTAYHLTEVFFEGNVEETFISKMQRSMMPR